jgi:hypothetical protein
VEYKNTIFSCRTYISTTTILVPSNLYNICACILVSILQHLSTILCGRGYLALIGLAGIISASQIINSALSFSSTALISNNDYVKLYPSYNLEVFDIYQLCQSWPYIDSHMISLGGYSLIYFSFNCFCTEVYFIFRW